MDDSCKTSNKPKTLKELLRSSYFWKPASGVIIGSTLGFLYYYIQGCSSGTCGITGNPISSTLFGGVLGLFFVNRPCGSCKN